MRVRLVVPTCVIRAATLMFHTAYLFYVLRITQLIRSTYTYYVPHAHYVSYIPHVPYTHYVLRATYVGSSS